MIKKTGKENIESQRLYVWPFKIKITSIRKSSSNLLGEVLKLEVNLQIFHSLVLLFKQIADDLILEYLFSKVPLLS